jgi:hypothetical protein
MSTFSSYECNRILNTTKCLKTRRRGDCPSNLKPEDRVDQGCLGRMFTPGGTLTKPDSYRLFSSQNN